MVIYLILCLCLVLGVAYGAERWMNRQLTSSIEEYERTLVQNRQLMQGMREKLQRYENALAWSERERVKVSMQNKGLGQILRQVREGKRPVMPMSLFSGN